jgi:hypothetical protein
MAATLARSPRRGVVDERKRKQKEAGRKAVETKGEAELSRAANKAAWTRKHGKNDAQNPYTKENANPAPPEKKPE